MNQDVPGKPLLAPPDINSTTGSTQAPNAPDTYCAYTAKVLCDPHNTNHDRDLLLSHSMSCQPCGELVAKFYGPATDEATGGTA